MEWREFALRAIGVPFVDRGRSWDGWDCWGMVVVAYRECLGIDLRPYDEISALDRQAVFCQMGAEIASRWRLVETGQENAGDAVLIRPCHVGLVIAPGSMLHVAPETGTCLVNYRGQAWCNLIAGFYRYVGD